jgi:predicted XRE-type DNA-binding protein
MESDKLKRLLEHWIEHSKEHTAKYVEWSEKLKVEMPEISRLLRRAVEKYEEGEKLLEEAYNKL